jgi:hypothetical protein
MSSFFLNGKNLKYGIIRAMNLKRLKILLKGSETLWKKFWDTK